MLGVPDSEFLTKGIASMMIGITQSTSILGKHKQNLIWRENIHSKTARSNYETQKWLPFLHRVSAPHLTLHTPELISDWL